LVSDARKKELINFASREDGKLVLDFVKEFGAFNLPVLFEFYLKLKRADNTEEFFSDPAQ